MGWFDESDESNDEETKNQNTNHQRAGINIPSSVNDDDDDDEEDPLDAYMKTLEASNTTATVSSSSKLMKQSSQQLEPRYNSDIDDDDEVYYGMTTTTTSNQYYDNSTEAADLASRSSHDELLPLDQNDSAKNIINNNKQRASASFPSSIVSQQAREALTKTFVKSGGSATISGGDVVVVASTATAAAAAADDDDDDDDGNDRRGNAVSSTMDSSASKRTYFDAFTAEYHDDNDSKIVTKESKQLLTQTQTTHDTFQKIFWIGSDTPDGRKWREENYVSYNSSRNSRSHSRSRSRGSGGNTNNNTAGSMKTETINSNDIQPPKYYDPIYEFFELRDIIGNDLLIEIMKHYTKPTIVQSQTVPIALAGCDAIITAATGQGKTLAYLWPIAVHLANQPPLRPELLETGPIALVLVPTRELALQVQQQAKSVLSAAISKEDSRVNGKLSSRAVIGGQGKYLLRQELKKSGGVDLVIATPGRLLDVLSDKKGLSLQRVTFVVLDEADKMLQMGFEAEVRQILTNIRHDRQTLMLSATMGHRIENVASEWLNKDAVRVSIGRTGEATHNVNQYAMILPDNNAKTTFLIEMLPTLVQIGRTLIFVATREGCEVLATTLRNQLLPTGNGVTIQTLHGEKHQVDRTSAVRSFSKGEINTLIATDVAGRGLDISNVQTVISYDPAKDLDTHIHRVGRAGRLSSKNSNSSNNNTVVLQQQQQTGSAYTLLTRKDADFALVLKKAFEREGHEITSDLEELAKSSRRQGGARGSTTVESRTTWNRSGVGHTTNNNNKDSNSNTTNDSWMSRLQQISETNNMQQQQQQQQQPKYNNNV